MELSVGTTGVTPDPVRRPSGIMGLFVTGLELSIGPEGPVFLDFPSFGFGVDDEEVLDFFFLGIAFPLSSARFLIWPHSLADQELQTAHVRLSEHERQLGQRI